MTISEVLIKAAKKLSKSTSPALDAEVLLSHVLDKPKEYLHINAQKKLLPKIEKQYFELITRRVRGWPVAYLRNKKEFFGLEFYVDENVLVPRPETEGLVELVLDKMKNKSDLKILDIGTGSGCIIISLAKNLGAKNQYFASDVSQTALNIAKKNARTYKIPISFKQSDLLQDWKTDFDLIIANLPYGWKAWKNNTSAETIGLKFEPQAALFTGGKGLYLITELLRQISQKKPLPKFVFLEFDPRQASAIKNLAAKWLPDYEIQTSKDLMGHLRFASFVLRKK